MITFKIVPDIRKGSGGLLCPRGPLSHTAGVAQLVEHLICNQRVRGSNPFASSRKTVFRKQRRKVCADVYASGARVLTHSIRAFSGGFAGVEQVESSENSCISFP